MIKSRFFYDKYPFKIKIQRNPYFFANVQWILFKLFGIKRTYPCGRSKKESYLCCCQPYKNIAKKVYLSEDKKSIICKVCGSIIMLSNEPIESIEKEISF